MCWLRCQMKRNNERWNVLHYCLVANISNSRPIFICQRVNSPGKPPLIFHLLYYPTKCWTQNWNLLTWPNIQKQRVDCICSPLAALSFPSLIHTSIPKLCPSPLLGIHGGPFFLCTSISNRGLTFLSFFTYLKLYTMLSALAVLNDIPLHPFTRFQLLSFEATIGSTFLSQFGFTLSFPKCLIPLSIFSIILSKGKPESTNTELGVFQFEISRNLEIFKAGLMDL